MSISNLVPFGRKEISSFRDPFEMLRREIDSLFDRSSWALTSSFASLELDVCDKGKEVVIKADVPGLEEKDISINLTNGLLTIQGEKKREEKKEEDNYYLMERSYGSFSRSIQLPFQVKDEDVEAKLDKGVLTISIKKPKEEQQQSRRIEIKSSGSS